MLSLLTMEREFSMARMMRWIIRRDLPAATAVLSMSPPPYNWELEKLEAAIARPHTVGLCCEDNGVLVGVAVYVIETDQVIIKNFAVRADYRRRKIGAAMINDLIRRLSVRRIVLHVPADNYAMQCLLRSCGVRATEVVYRRQECYQFEVPPQRGP